jgi:hypothetical protein
MTVRQSIRDEYGHSGRCIAAASHSTSAGERTGWSVTGRRGRVAVRWLAAAHHAPLGQAWSSLLRVDGLAVA